MVMGVLERPSAQEAVVGPSAPSEEKGRSWRIKAPEVELTLSTDDNNQANLNCSVRGFFPREIRAKFLKDGKVLQDGKESVHVVHGTLEKVDGAFNTWISTRVEPREKYGYGCLVNHPGLQKELLVGIKEAPEVELTLSTDDNNQANLNCSMRGFFPREITAKFLKNGKFLQDGKESVHIVHGTLEKVDGTFNTWISTRVEPREKDRYQCLVNHTGLPKELLVDVNDGGISGWQICVTVAVLAVLAFIIIAGFYCIWKKKCKRNAQSSSGKTSSESVFCSLTSGTEEETQSQTQLRCCNLR